MEAKPLSMSPNSELTRPPERATSFLKQIHPRYFCESNQEIAGPNLRLSFRAIRDRGAQRKVSS